MLRAMQKECHVFFLIRSHMINTNHPQKDLLFYEFKNKDHRPQDEGDHLHGSFYRLRHRPHHAVSLYVPP